MLKKQIRRLKLKFKKKKMKTLSRSSRSRVQRTVFASRRRLSRV